MTSTRPWRRMILHFSHIVLTDGRTFMIPFGWFQSPRLWQPERLPLPRSGRQATRRHAAPSSRRKRSKADGPGAALLRSRPGAVLVPGREHTRAVAGDRDRELEMGGQ